MLKCNGADSSRISVSKRSLEAAHLSAAAERDASDDS
jgi:hypothetical protein